ncbi:hypothetical protein PN462_02485 [Spirulina sp. CS-785/01]|uniref:hypothetical protein n=1 Tax=Spirulina sp. CS-785/01 TaxID=3021716 RepID=UPI00232E1670|nr:hypothetical protein [Spirulina sp. CS-785/01]MDB9311955.1 hypothetical protein [Spirulina sp. CS-785/01]
MANSQPRQPREDDAVLGSPNFAPQGAMVLGGLAGIQRRFASPVAEVRVAALQAVAKYGQEGVSLLLEGLTDDALEVQRVAYMLLQRQADPQVRRLLRGYLPYRLLSPVKTMKTGFGTVLSADGTRMAYRRGKRVYLCPGAGETLLYSLPAGSRELYAVTQEDYLIRIKNGGTPAIEVWQSGEMQFCFYGHQREITAVAVSPDGGILATGGGDTKINLWDLRKGKLVGTFGVHLTVGSHRGTILHLAFSPDGKQLVSSSRDQTVKVWDLVTRDRPITLRSYAACAALSPDGLTVATTGWYGDILLWDISTQRITRRFPGHLYSVKAMAFTPFGRLLVSVGRDSKIQFWDVYAGDTFHTLETSEIAAMEQVAILGEGEQVLTVGENKTLTVWGID